MRIENKTKKLARSKNSLLNAFMIALLDSALTINLKHVTRALEELDLVEYTKN